jgi:hypothetical protein
MPVRKKQSLWRNTTKTTTLLPTIKSNDKEENNCAHLDEYKKHECVAVMIRNEANCFVGYF